MFKGNENIKKLMSQDIVESLNDFLNSEEYEDKYEGNFTGIVVDNVDSDKVGKCKIRVFGVHGDKIQDKDLPWAFPDFDFRGGLKGNFIIPPVGCIVNVYFERGEIYIPRYSNKVIDENKLPTNKNDDYPDNMIFFETDNGDKFEINRKKKTVLFEHASGTKVKHTMKESEIEHHSGAKITIDNLGNITIDSPKSISLNHKIMTESNGKVVVPKGEGPFCCLPVCALTGINQVGNQTF